MPYLGQVPLTGNYNKLDSISSSFNASTTTFNLTAGSVAMEPVVAAALLVSVNGVLQQPLTDYTISGSTITFTTAPASTDVCFITIISTNSSLFLSWKCFLEFKRAFFCMDPKNAIYKY